MHKAVVFVVGLTAGLVAAALAIALREDGTAASLVGGQGPYRGSEPPGEIRLPSFALRDHTGELVRSSDLRGKVVVLTLLDSQCSDACPIIASEIASTMERLTPAEREIVAAVGISTDPAEDTPRSIHTFLKRQGALGSLRFLDGSERELRALWGRLAILSSHETGKDELHSAPVRIYNRRGVWVATQHVGVDLEPRNLVHDIRVALHAG